MWSLKGLKARSRTGALWPEITGWSGSSLPVFFWSRTAKTPVFITKGSYFGYFGESKTKNHPTSSRFPWDSDELRVGNNEVGIPSRSGQLDIVKAVITLGGVSESVTELGSTNEAVGHDNYILKQWETKNNRGKWLLISSTSTIPNIQFPCGERERLFLKTIW